MTKKNQKNKITTQVTQKTKQKPKEHDSFEMQIKYHSIPLTITTKADKENTEVKDLTPNSKKYSFGKIAFRNGILEYFMYPLSNLNRVLRAFSKNPISKSEMQSLDLRKTKENYSLLSKIRYFLSLSKKRKKEYLRKHGFSAYISMEKDI